jgi:two-component sensor histidine kinase
MLSPNTNSLISQNPGELLLLREMHHRLANTFTVLTSALRDLAIYSPEYQGSLARYEARIIALANLHRSLIVSANNAPVSFQVHVEHLCKALADAMLGPLNVRTEVVCDAGELPAVRCELLGLIIAELVTNAAKHAFSNRDNGLVRVECLKETDSWLCIVSDNGDAVSGTSSGFGSEIIHELVRILGGNLSRWSGIIGTTVVVSCPIS